MRGFLARRRPQDVVVGWRRRSRQRARVLTAVKARRCAPPPLRGADGLDGGSAHALQTGLVRRRNRHDPLHVVVDDLFGMARFSVLVDTQRQTRYRPRQAAIIEAIKTRARGLTTLETRFETVVGVRLWNAFLEVLTYDEILRDLRKAVRRTGPPGSRPRFGSGTGFFPRRRGSRIATITRWSRQTETGRAIPRATPHARGSRESTSDRYIKPEGRPFRVPGSDPKHLRVTA